MLTLRKLNQFGNSGMHVPHPLIRHSFAKSAQLCMRALPLLASRRGTGKPQLTQNALSAAGN